jgi:transcriptional regulator with XRE-family HTH domain
MSNITKRLLADPEVRRVFEEELLYGEVTDTISAYLESTKLSRSELSRRLGITKGRVSQVLSGNRNLTLKTLAALGWALGLRFELRAVPLADRAGTPAVNDPPPPRWLRYGQQMEPRFTRVMTAKSRGPEDEAPARPVRPFQPDTERGLWSAAA